MEVLGAGGGLLILLLLFLAVLWTILPFAIFGTKPLLRQLISEQEKTNALLTKTAELDWPKPETHVVCPACKGYARKDATLCKHCRTTLPGLSQPEPPPKPRLGEEMPPPTGARAASWP